MGQRKLLSVLVLCFFSLYLLFPSTQATVVKYCDRKADYPVKVHGITISPDPVVRGEEATFKVSASTSEVISGGKLVVEVAYLGVHIHSEDHDLSEEVSVPVPAGDFVLSHTQTLPGITPPGTYTLTMKLVDDAHKQLTCISFKFKIGILSVLADS
ncbi:uncharacterized protein LOC107403581 [Ziziphus jujuba]|uniref:Uncharacterized protein LOC107403581 n=2 Tax=Ziziphus jujuba TaxID=326968 RepID=A0A6P3YRC1_ZIZJJ|nr:uncharacterized protein LOC107403581 [Ziziphus jujuba]KAH7541819.1 hypothetical protein FEM48_Zijuj02G0008000 [Ziziphus jujuba var. spinosa]